MNPNTAGKAAQTALSSSIASVILVILYFTPWLHEFVLYGGIVLGIIGVVSGINALKDKQSTGPALTGIILGGLSALIGIAVVVFALVFVGAL